jgi:hypothetical protein
MARKQYSEMKQNVNKPHVYESVEESDIILNPLIKVSIIA